MKHFTLLILGLLMTTSLHAQRPISEGIGSYVKSPEQKAMEFYGRGMRAKRKAEGEKDPAETTRKVMESPSARESLREELRLKMALDRAVEIAKPVPIAPTVAVEDAAAGAETRSASGIWLPGDPT